MAFRHLTRAARVFGELPVNFLPAPAKADGKLYAPQGSHFVHVLANTGFGDDHELFALASAWRNLLRLIRPHLVVFDHSPIALLASRGLRAPDGAPLRRILLGTGFTCPPDVSPLPRVRSIRHLTIDPSTGSGQAPAQVADDEARVLRRVNWLLGLWKQPPLDRLAQLYSDVDDTFLATFPELDHCPTRPLPRAPHSEFGTRNSELHAPYYGPTNDPSGGVPPQWPESNRRPRIFAYLKRSPGLSDLLQSLADRKLPTLVYPDAIPGKIQKRFESDTLRFVRERPDPKQAAGDCDFALLNATHGTTCDALLAGKPILQVPLYGEQQLMAEACERLGVSQTIWPKPPGREAIDQTLDSFLASLPRHTQAAQAFAAKYAHFDPEQQRQAMLARTLKLLESTSPAPRQPEFALHYP